MALGPRLEFRQAQSLTLTPQLMQSIKLLQLSHLELQAFVDAELLRNPLLDTGEGSEAVGLEPAPAAAAAGADGDLRTLFNEGADAIADGLDTTVDNLFPEQVGPDAGSDSWGERRGGGGDAVDIEAFAPHRRSLADILEEDANLQLRAAGDRLIARHLIDGLDPSGYLEVPLEVMAAQLGAEIEDVEAVLGVLQGCGPAGLFARSVRECLELQLRARDRLDPLMAKLTANLDLVAAHDHATLLKRLGCDREDLLDMLRELRELDPRPGRALDLALVEAIVPDVFVRAAPDGGWSVELNTDVLPRVLVNRSYHAKVAGGTRSPADKSFLQDCLQSANWLTKSLDQRAQTILKVSVEIVRQQDGFLRHGVAALKPMTLRMVADAIDMHESTVSRVTSGKYLSTPRGPFEMKYFFTTALASSSGGDEHSAEAVRHRIKQLIDVEPPDAILSDDTIAAQLKREDGIDVARRTVAKYREGMNIPSSVVRRRQKQGLVGA